MKLYLKKNSIQIITILMAIFCNTHLIYGNFPKYACFFPDNLFSIKFYTIFTHAFIHVSWYHLTLDLSAFLIIVSVLNGTLINKIIYFLVTMTGSLIGASFYKNIDIYGFCGLSGIDHGLFIIICLQMITNGKKTGYIPLLFLIIKIAFNLYFNLNGISIHQGFVATPLLQSHIGGVVAGIAAKIMVERKALIYIPCNRALLIQSQSSIRPE